MGDTLRVAGVQFEMAENDKAAREGSLAGSHMLARRPNLYGKIVESVEEVDTRLVRNAVSNQTIG